jgi:hypothetical protein
MDTELKMKTFRNAARGLLLLAAAALAAAPAAAANYLWEVSSLTNKVYLFGTVHAGKPGWYPLPRPWRTHSSTRKWLRSKPTSPTPRQSASRRPR